MNGEYMRSYRNGANSTGQLLLNTADLRKQYPIDGILRELKITEEDIINAYYRLEQAGTVLR